MYSVSSGKIVSDCEDSAFDNCFQYNCSETGYFCNFFTFLKLLNDISVQLALF